MEEEIKLVIKKLKGQYVLFWSIPILTFIAYEAGLADAGSIADNPGRQYIWETIGVIITFILVPLSLKLFSIKLKKKIDRISFPAALKSYLYWSALRLALLEIAVTLNLLVYYATLNNIGGLCALIALTASAFCLPGEKRLREELRVDGEGED